MSFCKEYVRTSVLSHHIRGLFCFCLLFTRPPVLPHIFTVSLFFPLHQNTHCVITRPLLLVIKHLICADHIGLVVLDVLEVAHSSDSVVVVFIFVKLLLLYFSRGVVEELYVNLA